MNVVELTSEKNVVPSLKLPLRLATGTLITIRMRGHTHSPGGQEYFAPAIVLCQYNDIYGSIDAICWDATSGSPFMSGYHTREVAARGEGSTREMYESQSNIGEILFAPQDFARAMQRLEQLELDILNVLQAVSKMQIAQAASMNAKMEAPPVAPPLSSATATSAQNAVPYEAKSAKQTEAK